ncbi:MAG: RNA polymerase factor sigma-54 [Deltaproteobacteria bacterium]|nr:RNA polymerase factor sigma-54 [Deltaproteobacteria bacterium]
MELRQNLQLRQQLRLTMQLQQAIKLLQLNRLELATLVQQELAENPVLEELATGRPEEIPMADLDGTSHAQQDPRDDEEFRKLVEEFRQLGPVASGPIRRNDDLPPIEASLTRHEDLHDYLFWQLRMARLTDIQRRIGAEIIGDIDDNGYLAADGVPTIAGRLSVASEAVEEVRSRILQFDPVGVAAVTLEECLLVQAQVYFPDHLLVQRIIKGHLADLVGRASLTLHRKLGVTEAQLEEARELVTSLDPKPGRIYAGDDTQYVVPDVYVEKTAEGYVVLLNDDGLPKLRISAYYRNLVDRNITADTKEYLKKKLRSAVWFLRSIHQRQSTVRLVAESIVKFQKDFLDRGVSALHPLVLRDVAEDIEMHESTVSRVTSNKYMHTPQGLFPMKFFFNPRIESSGGEDLASEAVREKIRELIAREDPRQPLSDQQVVDTLAGKGIKLARRTVAKYRDQLGILPSSRRVRIS